MPVAYQLADVVVSSSIEPEAFGRVAVEAQAMSKPISVTGSQLTTAMSIILVLAEVAMDGGKADELRLGRPVIDQIVNLADEIKRND